MDISRVNCIFSTYNYYSKMKNYSWRYTQLLVILFHKSVRICETNLLCILQLYVVYIFNYKMFHQEASVETIKVKNYSFSENQMESLNHCTWIIFTCPLLQLTFNVGTRIRFLSLFIMIDAYLNKEIKSEFIQSN